MAELVDGDIADLPGAGAAGGLAFGAVAFLNARLVPGIETMMRAGGLFDALAGADWVITGEGKLDYQSVQGKVVSGVADAAAKASVQVAAIAGSVMLSADAATSATSTPILWTNSASSVAGRPRCFA